MKYPTTCFLIDNDEDDQEIFILALREFDPAISCITASNGPAAIEKLQQDQSFIPAFIFIDMNMPLMNGKECLREVKKMHHLARVPVYMYSTAADPASMEDVKQSGADDLVIKPSSYQELVVLLSKLLQAKNG